MPHKKGKYLPKVRDERPYLAKEILDKLETYEDYISYYIQLEENSTMFSWQKADLFAHLDQKMGDKSLGAIARDIRLSRNTVAMYARVSRAFPPEKRDSSLSFTHHFVASFADECTEVGWRFHSNRRFQWLEKAADLQMSTERLKELINEEKLKREITGPIIPCQKCEKSDQLTRPCRFYTGRSQFRAPYRFYLCERCCQLVLEFVKMV